MKRFNVATLLTLSSLFFLIAVVFTGSAQDVGESGEYVTAQGSPRSPIDNQRVFLLGDSQVVGQFGSAMLAHITAAGATYYARAGEVGWGVRNWWLHRHNINRYMRRHHPTLVLVELGGNDWQRSARSDYGTQVNDFWTYIREQAETNKPDGTIVSYCWISPAIIVGNDPETQEKQRGRDRAARVIRQTIGSEYYVESRDITGTYGRTNDGLHFTHAGANDWARRTIPRIEDCIRNQH